MRLASVLALSMGVWCSACSPKLIQSSPPILMPPQEVLEPATTQSFESFFALARISTEASVRLREITRRLESRLYDSRPASAPSSTSAP